MEKLVMVLSGVKMNWIGWLNDICKLFAEALGAFAAVSFGVAIFENQNTGIFVGLYALLIAALLLTVRRVK